MLPYKHRSALAKFCCGVAPIRLETGRYERLAVNNRICPLCNREVENEVRNTLISDKLCLIKRDNWFPMLNDDFVYFPIVV